jgi:hypothetical protein
VKRVTITISDEKSEWLDDLAYQFHGLSKSIIMELIIDMAQGNFTIEMIKQHYVSEFSRKKNGS